MSLKAFSTSFFESGIPMVSSSSSSLYPSQCTRLTRASHFASCRYRLSLPSILDAISMAS